MAIAKDPFNVIITGVGGQGNVLASQILGQLLLSYEYNITIGETYGASQRGGAVMSNLRISTKDQLSPLIPEGKCDLIIALEPVECLRMLDNYGNPDVMTLMNTRAIHPIDVISGNASYPELSQVIDAIKALSKRVWALNATKIALEIGDPIFTNIAILGALCGIDVLPVDRQGFLATISDLLPSYGLAENMKAFDRGRKVVQELI